MSDLIDKILLLTRSLYPNGRAFKMPFGGVVEKLHRAFAKSEARAYADALSILDSAIADNPNFDEDDAAQWERRLGLINNSPSSLPTRMMAINQKYNYPNSDAPRQHHFFIEKQLQDAGFDAYVYENNFGGATKSPEEILGTSTEIALHATTVRHGTLQHGAGYNNKIANYIEEDRDATFVIGANYRSTFYISGASINDFAIIPLSRKDEFRQLLLQLKPAQTVGFLFVNYI